MTPEGVRSRRGHHDEVNKRPLLPPSVHCVHSLDLLIERKQAALSKDDVYYFQGEMP